MAEEGVAVVSELNPNFLRSVSEANNEELADTIKDLAANYSGFLSLDFSKEKQFSDIVEELLTKLDEYIGFADLIRSDVNLTLFSTLISIQAKSQEMQKHFDRIDRLEAFVTAVRKNVAEVELLVDKAEADMGRLSSLKKAINSITLPSLFTSKPQSPRSPPPKVVPTFEAVPIFQTDDFFRYRPPILVSAAAAVEISAVGAAAILENPETGTVFRNELWPLTDSTALGDDTATTVADVDDKMMLIALHDDSGHAADSELTLAVCGNITSDVTKHESARLVPSDSDGPMTLNNTQAS